MRRLLKHRLACCLGALAVALCAAAPPGRQFHQEFEGTRPSWYADYADASYRVMRHDRTGDAARAGQRGERIWVEASQGTAIHFRHPAGGARVIEEMQLSLWVNASRPGVQLMARVVLPGVFDPSTGQAVAIVVAGQRHDAPGRWRELRVERMTAQLEQQLNVVRARLGRDVDLQDAFVDSALVNVYGGPGTMEVLLDDLQVKPYVLSPHAAAVALQANSQLPPAATVRVENDRLRVNGRPTFLRMVRHQGEPLATLKAAGFNALWLSRPEPDMLHQALSLELGVVAAPPELQPAKEDQGDASPAAIGDHWDAVHLWYIGSQLESSHAREVAARAANIRAADRLGRPVTGDVNDSLQRYSSELDLVGLGRWPLMGASSLGDYRQWLMEQARFARSGAILWTWIPTAPLQEADKGAALPSDSETAHSRGRFVEPEQLRLMTYAALSAGARGVGYWTHATLAGGADGPYREHLLSLALLNMEMRLLEPWLATGSYAGSVTTSEPEVEAAIIRSPKGLVVLPVWYGNRAEFVPGQLASRELTLVVPGVPAATPAWEVTGTMVRLLKPRRVSGGVQVQLDEFGVTSIVLFSGDRSVVDQLRRAVAGGAQQAARLRRELASAKLNRVLATETQLRTQGGSHSEAGELLQRAGRWLQQSHAWFRRSDYVKADLNARRTMRALRVLQRAEWDRAVAGLSDPAESPYTLCYNTLPEHWRFLGQLESAGLGRNLLTSGSFEDEFRVTGQGWRQIKQRGADAEAQISSDSPHRGHSSLRLKVAESDVPFGASGTTPLKVVASAVSVRPGQMLRVSGWVRVPPASGPPARTLLQDSSTAAPATMRWWQTDGWQPFTLYRRASSSGEFEISMSLTGAGEAYFDDLRIQPLELREHLAEQRGGDVQQDAARR